MRTGRPKSPLVLTPAERKALQILARQGAPFREALRAKIILDCAKGWDNRAVAEARGVNAITVGKWRQRFGNERMVGLKDAPRSRKDPSCRREDSSLRAERIAEEMVGDWPSDVERSSGVQKRVTLRDIAAHLKLHLSTVSLGIKNDPRLLLKTRMRILEAAKRMGYSPDPMVQALAVYRQGIRPPSMHGTLALLAYVEDAVVSLMEVASKQAALSGYKIELIDAYAARRSNERLTRILRSRGIQGLLVLPPGFGRKKPRRLQLDWKYFSAVALGHALYHPVLHQVGNDHLGNAQLLTRKLLSLGYRRIGLCVDEHYASIHAGGGWEGGYFGEMRRQKDIPKPFYRKEHEPDSNCIQKIKKWIREERLEVIIVDTSQVAFWVQPSCREVVTVCLACFSYEFPGINPCYERVWEAAVDFLVHLIHTRQRGIPAYPRRILLKGDWVPGETLYRMNL